MYLKVCEGRMGGVLGREEWLGVVDQERIGRLKSQQRIKGGKENNTVMTSDNLSKKSLNRKVEQDRENILRI